MQYFRSGWPVAGQMLSRICFWKVAGILELLSMSLLATCFGIDSTGDAHCSTVLEY